MKYKKSFYNLLSVIILYFFWESIADFFRDIPLLCPSPLKVFKRVFSDYTLFWSHGFFTFLEMLLGMLVAIVVSFFTAYLMFRIKFFRSILEPYFVVMQCIPMFVLAPIFIIWFGWSFMAIILPTSMMIAFPLTMNIYKGLSSAPRNYLEFFKLHGASDWQLLFRVQLPFARPHIFAGLRISTAIAGVGAIAGEWAGAQRGLGVLIQICRRNFDLEGVFACIFCLLFLSLSFYGMILLIEKQLIKGNNENIDTQKAN